MALNFPTTSTTGTVYTEGNRTWIWNGRFWQASSTSAGFVGSTGTQGQVGFTGSTGTQGVIGFTGSRGIAGGTEFVFQNSGSDYSVDGFAGTFPTLTVVRGQLYYFNLTNITSTHPLALRLSSGSTSAVPGTTGNNPSSGAFGNGTVLTIVTYQVPFDAPNSIVYRCVIHSYMIGTINIVDQTGYTGSTGTQGVIGFTGSTGTQGQVGFVGSQGEIGFTGSTGTQGIIGFTGSAGSAASGISSTGTTSTFTISNTSSSTSTTTGALVVTGGVGIGGNINFGGNLYQNGVLFTGGGGSGYTGSAGSVTNIVGTTSTYTLIPGYTNIDYTGAINDGYTTSNGDLYVWKGSLVAGVTPPPTVEYLVVAGGGGGFKGKTGTYWGGGGGAGQVLSGSGLSVSPGAAISVTIGAGGVDQPNLDANGFAGFSSQLLGITATGGGGGLYNTGYGGTSGNGYTGGSPSGGATAGGGGGAGFTGSGQNGGNGLTSSITGTSTYYGGGGSAGRGDSSAVGTPGLGGGGTGSNAVNFTDPLCQGAPNTGGGGGGGGGGNNKGSAGGSGIVIIRYANTYTAASATTGTVSVTTASGYIVYRWTDSGSITFPTAVAGTAGLGWVLAGNIKGYTGSASTATGYTGSSGISSTGTTSTFTISNTSSSTSTTTGALVVTGGVGVGGNINFGGNLYQNGVLFTGASGTAASGTGTTSTFIISNTSSSTSTITGALVVSGGVGIGGDVNIGGAVTGGGIRTTSTSTAPLYPTVGDIWYKSTTDNMFRFTSDGAYSYWLDITGPTISSSVTAVPGVIVARSYSGNGSQTTFSVTTSCTVASVIVTENGVVQAPTTDYTISGGTLTFVTAPASGIVISIRELTSTGIQGVIGYTGSASTATGATGYTYVEATSSISASVNTKYIVDTNSANLTITLPSSPALGDEVGIIDGTGNASVYAITIGRNGKNIQGVASNLTVTTNRSAFTLVYYNVTQGWILTNV